MQDDLTQRHWERIARSFLGDDPIIESVSAVRSGLSGASLIRVITSDGHYLLRQWSQEAIQETFPRSRILELHRFLGHLNRAGIPVAVPVSLCETIDTLKPVGSDLWHCEPWLTGTASTSTSITTTQLQAMMQTIARMHVAAQAFAPSEFGAPWFRSQRGPCPAIVERLSIIHRTTSGVLNSYQRSLQTAPTEFAHWGRQVIEYYQRLAPRINLELRRFETSEVELHPCWRDLRDEHVLLTGEHVTGLIDPTAARFDHVATDVSRLLGDLYADDFSQWEQALEYYHAVKPLSPLDRELIQVLDRSRVLLSGMTWLQRWHDRQLTLMSLPHLQQRLQLLADRLSQLRRSSF